MPTTRKQYTSCDRCGTLYNRADDSDRLAHEMCAEREHATIVTGELIPLSIVGVRGAANELRAGVLVNNRVILRQDVADAAALRKFAMRCEYPARIMYIGVLDAHGDLSATLHALYATPVLLGTATRLSADFVVGADDLFNEGMQHMREIMRGRARDPHERAIELLIGGGL